MNNFCPLVFSGKSISGKEIDLVEKSAEANREYDIRRKVILDGAKVVFSKNVYLDDLDITNQLAIDFPSVTDSIDYHQLFGVIDGIQDPIITHA